MATLSGVPVLNREPGQPCDAAGMDATERAKALLAASVEYPVYDEVVEQVSERILASGSVGKLDIAALTAWKRLRADTIWNRALMRVPETEVRRSTEAVVAVARDLTLSVREAASAARGHLSGLPGFGTGDALASAVCFAAAPERLAVYDRRAHAGLTRLGLNLDNKPGRYGRYMELVEQCGEELSAAGTAWTARQVDLALYQLGQRGASTAGEGKE